jgi:site-specific recombinase XerD
MTPRRPLRECLPSKEREEYVVHVRRRGCTFVTERQVNRYIDEFLRFCEATFGHTNAQRIGASDLMKYGKYLEQREHTFVTARAKMTLALQWCRWLAATKRIARDPAPGMKATAMVSSLRKGASTLPSRQTEQAHSGRSAKAETSE